MDEICLQGPQSQNLDGMVEVATQMASRSIETLFHFAFGDSGVNQRLFTAISETMDSLKGDQGMRSPGFALSVHMATVSQTLRVPPWHTYPAVPSTDTLMYALLHSDGINRPLMSKPTAALVL